MYVFFFYFFFIVLVVLLIYFLNFLFTKKNYIDREKSSPFECGFDPLTSPRIPFCVNFFLVALVFLVFDIEVIMLFPLVFFLELSLDFIFINLFFFFMCILLFGLFIEWSEGFLNWII